LLYQLSYLPSGDYNTGILAEAKLIARKFGDDPHFYRVQEEYRVLRSAGKGGGPGVQQFKAKWFLQRTARPSDSKSAWFSAAPVRFTAYSG